MVNWRKRAEDIEVMLVRGLCFATPQLANNIADPDGSFRGFKEVKPKERDFTTQVYKSDLLVIQSLDRRLGSLLNSN